MPRGLRVASRVRSVDLAPTLLALLGLDPAELLPGRDGVDLAPIRGNENRYPTPSVRQRRDEMGQSVLVLRNFQTPFGRTFLAALGHDANRMWTVTQRNGLHFVGCRHFKIQRHR